MKGVQTHYVVPMRLLINLAHAEDGNKGMNDFIAIAQGVMLREMPLQNFKGLTLRQMMEEYEFRRISDFYVHLTREEQNEFRAEFESPGMFGESPLYAFRNSGGVDFV